MIQSILIAIFTIRTNNKDQLPNQSHNLHRSSLQIYFLKNTADIHRNDLSHVTYDLQLPSHIDTKKTHITQNKTQDHIHYWKKWNLNIKVIHI